MNFDTGNFCGSTKNTFLSYFFVFVLSLDAVPSIGHGTLLQNEAFVFMEWSVNHQVEGATPFIMTSELVIKSLLFQSDKPNQNCDAYLNKASKQKYINTYQ